jgi:hypothetical protein
VVCEYNPGPIQFYYLADMITPDDSQVLVTVGRFPVNTTGFAINNLRPVSRELQPVKSSRSDQFLGLRATGNQEQTQRRIEPAHRKTDGRRSAYVSQSAAIMGI